MTSKKIIIDGEIIKTTELFLSYVCEKLGIPFSVEKIKTMYQLNEDIFQQKSKVIFLLENIEALKLRMVRESDVPLDELPSEGPNMLMDFVLDHVYKQISLYDKIQSAFRNNDFVKFQPLN
ncbi:hypothetical protein ABW636_21360 [Aquimarina sp. 2201CG1-2-11]|uniref:hypothetical protein n=1 Tax=Aquimarina discodermiae TaxID=3231043 RepID=UPI003461A59B